MVVTFPRVRYTIMPDFSSPFSRTNNAPFDRYHEFVPENLPEPGPFLDGHDVLTDDRHSGFHRLTKRMFDERGVYDMTFGYNLARLNLDGRHPDAGYRYAEETMTIRRSVRSSLRQRRSVHKATHSLSARFVRGTA